MKSVYSAVRAGALNEAVCASFIKGLVSKSEVLKDLSNVAHNLFPSFQEFTQLHLRVSITTP